MAVKVREKVTNDMSLSTMALIAVVVIVYVTLYELMVNHQSDVFLRSVYGLLSIVIMVVTMILLIRYMFITFNMVLTHDRLEIERVLTKHFTKVVLVVPTSDIIGIWPKKEFDQKDKITGEKKSFNISFRDHEDSKLYMMLYHKDGKVAFAQLQCSNKMHRALKKIAKANASA